MTRTAARGVAAAVSVTAALATLGVAAGVSAARAPLPDLTVRSASAGAVVVRDGALPVSAVVRNRGARGAPRTRVGFYLARHGEARNPRLRLGRARVRELGPKRRSRVDARVRVPDTVTRGAYRLVACADDGHRVREAREHNNCGAARTLTTVVGRTVSPVPSPPFGPAPAPIPDTTPPAPDITTPGEGATTTDPTPTVAGTAGTADGDSAAVTVSVYAGPAAAGTPIRSLTATRSGDAFAVAVTPALPEGVYTATAEQSDAAGNTGTSPERHFSVGPATLLAAGDIASCDNDNDSATEALLAARPDAAVATLGDNVYGNASMPEATLQNFNDCYAPTWGLDFGRTHPSIGNHEYQDPNAAGYFSYFGPRAGEVGKGYYSYDVGAWHVITLNGNCGELPAGTGANGCSAGSPQEAWLESDLAAQPAGECEIAVWHQPRFSSGAHGNDVPDYEQFWRDLYAAGAEVVLNGHDHDYERFLPQRYDGLADPAAGITEFVVGTGGRSLKGFTSLAPNSAVRDDTHFGVLELTLHQGSYEWAFLPTGGGGPLDSGTGSCH